MNSSKLVQRESPSISLSRTQVLQIPQIKVKQDTSDETPCEKEFLVSEIIRASYSDIKHTPRNTGAQ